MQVNPVQNITQALSAVTSLTGKTGFQALLESASHNQVKPTENIGKTAPTGEKTALQELEEYLKKSPIQHMRDAILQDMGLTEADLAAMPPATRDAVEATIAARIKEYLLGDKAQAQIGQVPSVAMRLQNGSAVVQDKQAIGGVIA